ncbi:MAG: hypothetical protein ACFBSE_26075 [Prochloraceae cyanobacterium]
MTKKNHLHKLNYRGLRSSKHSKSSNSNSFDPYDSEIDKKYFDRYYSAFNSTKGDLKIEQCCLNPDFIMPVTKAEVSRKLERLPNQFLKDLKGVMLLGGSKKQLKTAYSGLSCYGTYYDRVIFLLAFPKEQLTTSYVNLPAPHIKKDYEKAGAIYYCKNNLWHRYFSLNALKTFYLNDVLIHELGHHVDRNNKNDDLSAEKYAEWFARQYGYKSKNFF